MYTARLNSHDFRTNCALILQYFFPGNSELSRRVSASLWSHVGVVGQWTGSRRQQTGVAQGLLRLAQLATALLLSHAEPGQGRPDKKQRRPQ